MIISNLESPFEFHELFFSTTDKRGVITSCNQTFVKIAGHPRENLLGAPHSIIRHPDMPRGVFALLWDYLQRDLPIAAYVKNMSADGKYYWVMAYASPLKDGYLSVRFKPSSEILDVVKKLYTELLEWEKALGESGVRKVDVAQRSKQKLLERLAELGFASYDDFFEYALPIEFKARKDKLDAINYRCNSKSNANNAYLQKVLAIDDSLNAILSELSSFTAVRESLMQNSTFIESLAQSLSLTSLNALVAAEQLGDAGRVISAVAHHIGITAKESSQAIKGIQQNTNVFIPKLRFAGFSVALAKLQLEMLAEFLREVNLTNDEPADQTVNILSEATRQRVNYLNSSVGFVEKQIDVLSIELDLLKKSLVCLESTQVFGLIEAAKVASGDNFKNIFDGIRNQVIVGKDKVLLLEDEIKVLAKLCKESSIDERQMI